MNKESYAQQKHLKDEFEESYLYEVKVFQINIIKMLLS